jgi:hypothetical protein
VEWSTNYDTVGGGGLMTSVDNLLLWGKRLLPEQAGKRNTSHRVANARRAQQEQTDQPWPWPGIRRLPWPANTRTQWREFWIPRGDSALSRTRFTVVCTGSRPSARIVRYWTARGDRTIKSRSELLNTSNFDVCMGTIVNAQCCSSSSHSEITI